MKWFTTLLMLGVFVRHNAANVIADWTGIIEGLMASGCRLAIDDIHKVPQGVDTCDYLAGFPLGKAVMIFYLLLICRLAGKESRAKRSC